jgi:hypothetical protein
LCNYCPFRSVFCDLTQEQLLLFVGPVLNDELGAEIIPPSVATLTWGAVIEVFGNLDPIGSAKLSDESAQSVVFFSGEFPRRFLGSDARSRSLPDIERGVLFEFGGDHDDPY